MNNIRTFDLYGSTVSIEDSQAIGIVSAKDYAEMVSGILKSMLEQSRGLYDAEEENHMIYFPSASSGTRRLVAYSDLIDAADELTYQLMLKVHRRVLKKSE